MTPDEWCAAAVACAEEQERRTGEPRDQLELALTDFYWLMRDIPIAADEAYKALRETQLERAGAQRAADLLGVGSAPSWKPASGASIEAVAATVAIAARGADAALWSLRDRERPANPNLDYRAGSKPRAVFVIPREIEPKPFGKKGDSKPFVRRGFRFHRVVPAEIGGARVRLVLPQLTGPGMNGEASMLAAAMFTQVDLDTTRSADGTTFEVVGHLNAAAVAADFVQQVASLHQPLAAGAGCLAAVWPELTVTPEMLDELKVVLAERGLADDPGHPPGFLVAGSWHVRTGAALHNTAPVLDGIGLTLFTFNKMRRFPYEGADEGIDPGEELPILLYGDRLVGFAICRDFCELAGTVPALEMGVDLMVVPSYGNEQTWNGHVDTAKKLRVNHNARTFMVQQSFPPRKGGGGWVIGAPDDPDKAKIDECAQVGHWQAYAIDAT